MDLNVQCAAVLSRADLVAFVNALRRDHLSRPEEWQNASLADFLEALSAWIDDMKGYYDNQGLPVPNPPGWKGVAEMLLAAKYYE